MDVPEKDSTATVIICTRSSDTVKRGLLIRRLSNGKECVSLRFSPNSLRKTDGILMRWGCSCCEFPVQTYERLPDVVAKTQSAPPNRGLAREQMSGKKVDKNRITLGLACNADGSEKDEVFFIGKSKMLRCFKKVSPEARGFYY